MSSSPLKINLKQIFESKKIKQNNERTYPNNDFGCLLYKQPCLPAHNSLQRNKQLKMLICKTYFALHLEASNQDRKT